MISDRNTESGSPATGDPMDPNQMTSLKHWGVAPRGAHVDAMRANAFIDCGWGRLIFGQTFEDPATLVEELAHEKNGQRDVALYSRDSNVVISLAPQQMFLDPSLTFRLPLEPYGRSSVAGVPVDIRLAYGAGDEDNINRIYKSHGMVPVYPGFLADHADDNCLVLLVAVDRATGKIVGTVTGVDHRRAIEDPDNGSSLWALGVDSQCPVPGVGMYLVHALACVFKERGRAFMDLSVMHDNDTAIALYRQVGFEQVPVYCIKNKNTINEPLFVGPEQEESLNIYAQIIVDAARRRGIFVEVQDAENGFFRLSLGGKSISCRESLSDFTSAVAMSRCDDKSVTRKLLANGGIRLPAQAVVESEEDVRAFLKEYPRVVVKPARGEQGNGISIDLRNVGEIMEAMERARQINDKVLLEEYVEGEDLRIIVIDGRVVAAAVRRPPVIQGDGKHTIRELIDKQSRRRRAATGGESMIPLDDETMRTLRETGYELDDVLDSGVHVTVRKTANLHTGGTIHDVTDHVNPRLVSAAVAGARILDMPVVGFDFLVPDVKAPEYHVIEANERPGLANHEPQPVAERFIDYLFPQTRSRDLGRRLEEQEPSA
ncbi:MAG: N-acetylglutaminylglutamine synthetase [Alphaproteobacteria bacterium]